MTMTVVVPGAPGVGATGGGVAALATETVPRDRPRTSATTPSLSGLTKAVIESPSLLVRSVTERVCVEPRASFSAPPRLARLSNMVLPRGISGNHIAVKNPDK